MKELVCENDWRRISSPFMVTDCLGNFFTGVYNARKSLKWKKVPWQGHKLSGEIILKKWLKNKIKLNLAPTPPPQKKKHLPNMEIIVALTKKRKGCPYKVGTNRLELYKSSNNLLLWKIIL